MPVWESDESLQRLLKDWVKRHLDLTGSLRASEVLKEWEQNLRKFWLVVPRPPASLKPELAVAGGRSKTV